MSETLTPPPSSGAPAAVPVAVATRRDLRRTWRILAAIVIPLGPLAVTFMRWVMPYWTDQTTDEAVPIMADNLGGMAALNWLALLGYPFMLLGALALGFALRRRVPVLATIGSGVLFMAYALGAMVGSSDVVAEAMLRAGYDDATVVDVSTLVMDHPTGLVGILAFVFGHLLGLILLGIAVARSGLVHWWVGVLIVVAQPVHVISAVLVPSRALDVIGGWGATTLGFAIVALAVLRTSDDEWDAPPLPREEEQAY
ncbi:hypothetical protein GA707_12350 [Nostocoides sp. F2B08]|uniref:hypothetical protein n=1 Tax=Nostocoides sp. F2B08 TaxID=2653936 RepID=UPI001263B125|nr:hypothetical protein [Tetrasphaera sp. F2B08]KAB7744226.1 hypothetical protein GA707_12350 [Tetrasphaera sp. F2B08]